jgi:hypothetical protein
MVEILWRKIVSDDDEAWDQMMVLYAYLHPRRGEILNIGKAGRQSVWERYSAADKRAPGGFWRWLAEAHPEIDEEDVIVLVGLPDPEQRERLTEQLLHDLEGLLINRIRPRGNVASTRTRGYSRPV